MQFTVYESFIDIRAEILWHINQDNKVENSQRLLEWWLNSHSEITSIASAPPPNDLISITRHGVIVAEIELVEESSVKKFGISEFQQNTKLQ